MKILLVCPFYPPEGEIAALRIEAFARHWSEAGHSVGVLARTPLSTGTVATQSTRVDVVRALDPLMRFSRDHTKQPPSTGLTGFRRVRQFLIRLGRPLIFPDIYVVWAFMAARMISRTDFRPDIVVASGGPLSGLMLGGVLAHRYKVDLVVDFRDPLATSSVNLRTRARTWLETRLERRVVERAKLACAVSPSLADELSAVHNRAFEVVMNGYEEETWPPATPDEEASVLKVVYTGRIYESHTEYLPFFRAVSRFGQRCSAKAIEIHYYGRSSDSFLRMANKAGAGGYVVDHGEVDHETSVKAQASADLLLLLLWNDPRAMGTLSGKLFEYIGARRPVLMLGYLPGDAAQLIRRHDFGLASNTVSEIEEYLLSLAARKVRVGHIETSSYAEREHFTREKQSLTFLGMFDGSRESAAAAE